MPLCAFDPILGFFHRILFLLVARNGAIGYCIHYLTDYADQEAT